MVDKVEIPAETQQETQEYRDEMAKKADDANNVANTETAPEPVQQQEEQLILGKFKTQEDLIKSYQELERKQSQSQEEAPKEESKLEANTKVNFDFSQAQSEFEENGELSEQTINNLEKAGLPKSYIDNYLAGLEAVAQKFEQQAYDSTGGEDNYKRMTDWVTENLPEQEIQQFNDNIGKDNETALFTIKGMYARFQSETKEPSLATGSNAQQSGAAYESVGQMKADMSDPRYATDSAFRKMVADKVARSKVI
tara:strand:+ start:2895 stop:3653 length:759 start_codon:yes stop_codon:yes gene_type:complete